MKKSKLTFIALLISLIAAICVSVYILMNKKNSDKDSDDFSSISEDDYIDDLDIPEFSEDPAEGDKTPAKIRRGYIPIRLNRD